MLLIIVISEVIARNPAKRPTRLSATFFNTVNVPGRYGDGRGGHGLSLLVKPATHGGFSKSWAQRIRLDGNAANVGLGAYPVVTLARARQKALANAQIVSEGRDPRDRTGRALTPPTRDPLAMRFRQRGDRGLGAHRTQMHGKLAVAGQRRGDVEPARRLGGAAKLRRLAPTHQSGTRNGAVRNSSPRRSTSLPPAREYSLHLGPARTASNYAGWT